MQRLELVHDWLAGLFPGRPHSVTPASADASFRRYFRVSFGDGTTHIVMDAPPEHEDCRPFVRVAGLLQRAGVHAPEILAEDLARGLLLLTDLGNTTYLDALDASNADALFRDAIDALVKWQLASRPDALPPYDEALLRRELSLFPDWYVARHLGAPLTAAQQEALEGVQRLLLQNLLAQPRVFVHRDYMPRNLMVSEPKPGVLDFQDAVIGPVTYDVASFFATPSSAGRRSACSTGRCATGREARRAGLPVDADFASFYRDMEWMGLQRHLKVLGIFARINYRDGKPKYLADTPRFVGYVRHAATRYAPLAPLARLFDELEERKPQVGYTF
jgi:aminoglycoside/choline kinase family phosphotransferase